MREPQQCGGVVVTVRVRAVTIVDIVVAMKVKRARAGDWRRCRNGGGHRCCRRCCVIELKVVIDLVIEY